MKCPPTFFLIRISLFYNNVGISCPPYIILYRVRRDDNISQNMVPAIEDAYQCTPVPKIVILVGACAISGGVFQGSPALHREFIQKHPIDLYIPGCPTHPLAFVSGIRLFLGH